MSSISLQKVLNVMLIQEFPGIDEVKVVEDIDSRFINAKKLLKVSVGITFPAMEIYQPHHIKKRIDELSKYVLASNEKISNIVFFDSSIKNGW